MQNCRVLLVEDDSRLASSLLQYLELNQITCDYASDGQQALQLAQQQGYDVFVTDISMPHVSGLELCTRLRGMGIDTPLLMISSHGDLTDKELGFDAGTDDYLVKPFALKELLLRIQALSKRKSQQATQLIIEALGLRIDIANHKVWRDQLEINLSKSAWILLLTLARAWPNAVQKEKLEFALWGDDVPDSNSLKVHIHHLRQRLDQPFDTPLVHAVRGVGFLLSKHHD